MRPICEWMMKTPIAKFISSIFIIGMAVIMGVNVFTRYFLGFSFNWGDEILRYMAVIMAFFGIIAGWGRGSHISITIITEHIVPEQYRKYVRIFGEIVSIIFLACLIRYGIVLVQRVARTGQLSAALGIPISTMYAIVPFASALSIVQIVLHAVIGKSYLKAKE